MSHPDDHPLNPSMVRLRAVDGSVQGAGFLVAERLVCTCAHVVAHALGIDPLTEDAPTQEIHLDFPFLGGAAGSARVEVWKPVQDIAILRLGDDPPGQAQPARLVSGVEIVGKQFEVWGFPSGNDAGGMACGELGYRRGDGTIQIEGTTAKGYRVQPGFSGAPVWAPELGGVVGMVVAFERDVTAKVAFIIPNDLTHQVVPTLQLHEAQEIPQERIRLLPPTWNVPHLRNPNFTGRDAILEDLRSRLTSGRPAATTQVLYGFGGLGKTQLTVEYAYQYATDYDVVWWIRAGDGLTLAADYASLARDKDLPVKDLTDQSLVIAAVRRWLQQHDRWLLVLDNAEGFPEVRDYLPPGSTGHTLISSQNQVWRGRVELVPLPLLTPEESIAFLLKRTGQTDRTAAAALAEEMRGLPLALEQAAAYIEESSVPLSEYLDLFRTRRLELWNDEKSPVDYPDTVATTWNLAMARVREISPTGAELLNLFAFIASAELSYSILNAHAGALPEPVADTVADRLKLNRALAAFRRFSLVEVDEQGLLVHALVQLVTRARLTSDEERLWAGAAVRLVNAGFPVESYDVRWWPECERLLPHALAAASHAERLETAPEATSALLNRVGRYLRGRGQFAEAKPLLERALTIAEQAYDPAHPEVATILSNLALVLWDLGKPDQAKPLYERALRIAEQAYDPAHPTVARDLNSLALVLRDLGKPDQAKPLLERALRIAEQVYGPQHPNVVTILTNLQSLGEDHP